MLATEIVRAYRKIHASAFAHIPRPKLTIKLYACEFDGEWYYGIFESEPYCITIWRDAHDSEDDILSTLIHELTHAEQHIRQQPLTHGARFDRRRRKLAARVKL